MKKIKDLGVLLRRWPRRLFLQSYWVIEASLIMLGIGAMIAVVVQFLGREPAREPDTSQERVISLDQAVIDQLELWVEERNDSLQAGLKAPDRIYFSVKTP